MNKKIIIAIAVLLLLGVGYFLWNKSKTAPLTPNSLVGTSEESSSSSLRDLFASGIAQTCTYASEGNKGTVYISSGKMRGDFEATTDSKTTLSHMIVDGKTSYIWMEGEKTGFKMTFNADDVEGSTDSSNTQTTGAVDLNQSMDYKCGAWVVDSSMFALPSGVIFQEFSIPSVAPSAKQGESQPSDSASQCSYCASLTGDSKTQCLVALKCN